MIIPKLFQIAVGFIGSNIKSPQIAEELGKLPVDLLAELSEHFKDNSTALRMIIKIPDLDPPTRAKAAVLLLENCLIRIALSRKNKKLPSGKKHGIFVKNALIPVHELKRVGFHWFGKQHGIELDDNAGDSPDINWYINGKLNGPCIAQIHCNGACNYKFYKNGKASSGEILFCINHQQALTIDEKYDYAMRKYESANILASIVSHHVRRVANIEMKICLRM